MTARPTARPIATPLARPIAGAGESGSVALLLDTYTGAAAAYSLRRLRTAYSGACIRVRRSSDNSEQDFGFVNNALDTASILAFCGAGNGFVTTWYDQSGNSRNVTQSTTTAQPQIVTSGAIETEGSLAALRFDGNRFMQTASNFGASAGLSGNVGFSTFAIVRRTSASGSFYGWGDGATALGACGFYDNNAGFTGVAFAGGNFFNTTATPTTRTLRSHHKSLGAISTTTSAFRNGVSVAGTGHSTSTPNVSGTQPLSVGQFSSIGIDRLTGALQEFVLYPTNNSANRVAIEFEANSYWGVY